jgi:O-methyltransferase
VLTFDEMFAICKPHSVVSRERMMGLYQAVNRVRQFGVAGDIVECGSFRGGTAAMMALACDFARHVWLFDSWEGMPAPTADDPPGAAKATSGCRVNLPEVVGFLETVGVLKNGTMVKGWFKDTFPLHEVKQIAVLHVDCDWHDSVKLSLDTFYDLVSPGGVVQIDDYGHWAGARKAVDDFFKARGIEPLLVPLDYTGVQHVKGA